MLGVYTIVKPAAEQGWAAAGTLVCGGTARQSLQHRGVPAASALTGGYRLGFLIGAVVTGD